MAIAAVPRRHRSLLGVLADSAPAIGRAAARVLPLVREHAVTVAALATADWACWQPAGTAGRVAGGVVTAMSALLLDWLVRG